jgi:Tfp pilus assembly protein PilF
MGNERVIDRVEEKKSNEDVNSRLHDDAYSQVRRNGSDRTETAGTTSGGSRFDNPYDHVTLASGYLREFESLKEKNNDEKIKIAMADGQTKEVTVGERRKQLLEAAQGEFTKSISAADRIDQGKVDQTLMANREKQGMAKDLQELDTLKRTESMLEAMKHAPSVSRFAYGSFLADSGNFGEAKRLLDEAAAKDAEAKNDKTFQDVYQAINGGLTEQQNRATDAQNPFQALQSADDKRKAGDAAGADAAYKLAVEQADKIDVKAVAEQLHMIEEAKKTAKNDTELTGLQQQESLLTGLLHAQAITRINYGDFLNEQKRYDEAKVKLTEAAQLDSELVKGSREFAEMMQLAANKGQKPEPFDNPFDHLSKFQKFFENGDVANARFELETAVKASDKIDREMMKNNKKIVEDQMKEEKDPEKLKALQGLKEAYDGFEHAAAFSRVALARFELANKNYNVAQGLLEKAGQMDPEFVKRPEIKMDELKEAAKEPSTWDKVCNFTKGLLKELACDAVAILAGAGAALLTGWSGPAAIGVGAVAGAGAYTAMKALMGEEIHWYTPLWGALDGATGGAAAIARTALVKTAGGIVSKEMAGSVMTKTGANVAALEGLEGMKMASTAQTLAKEGLKQMGKDVGFWSRMGARVPFTSLGSTEYRAALNAYRGLKYSNLAINIGVDAGTAGAGALVYHGGHDGVKFANGEYKSFGDFMKNYAGHVTTDAALGGFVGGPLSRYVGGTATEGMIAKYTGLGKLATRVSSFGPTLSGSFVASSPEWARVYMTEQQLRNEIEPMMEYLQTPVRDRAELRERMYYTPGTEDFPVQK